MSPESMDIKKDKDMENKDIKKLAIYLVGKVRDARMKGKKKPSDSPPEVETAKE